MEKKKPVSFSHDEITEEMIWNCIKYFGVKSCDPDFDINLKYTYIFTYKEICFLEFCARALFQLTGEKESVVNYFAELVKKIEKRPDHIQHRHRQFKSSLEEEYRVSVKIKTLDWLKGAHRKFGIDLPFEYIIGKRKGSIKGTTEERMLVSDASAKYLKDNWDTLPAENISLSPFMFQELDRKLDLSYVQYAGIFGVVPLTIQNWISGRTSPASYERANTIFRKLVLASRVSNQQDRIRQVNLLMEVVRQSGSTEYYNVASVAI